MTRSACRLSLAIVLVGLGSAAIDARPARAGCHVAQRPATLGLLLDDAATRSEIRPPSIVVAELPAQFAPRPCGDEAANARPHAPAVPPIADRTAFEAKSTTTRATWSPDPSPGPAGREDSGRLDRPPRG